MKKPKDKEMKNCPLCGKDFLTSISNKKCCSFECAQSYKKKQYHDIHELQGIGIGTWAKLRWTILSRDMFQCQYCGRTPVNHGVALHVDHIVPRNSGGTDAQDNLVTSCEDCNWGKGTSENSYFLQSYLGEKGFRIAQKGITTV